MNAIWRREQPSESEFGRSPSHLVFHSTQVYPNPTLTLTLTQVYHACRTAEGAQQAVVAAGGGEPMVCDLADLQSVRAFASALSEKAATLDCLCLNSGVSPSRKVS